jgi:F-type H+-transporting ATPase subunit beta
VIDDLQLNVPLLRRRVPNLTVAARTVGLRPATVSDLCNGKIPVGRAEVRTLAALAALAGCSLDELVLRGGGAGVIETGIKVVDLLAPLVRGGTAGFVARQGLGQAVVASELVHRLKQRGFATFVWLPTDVHPHMKEIVDEAEASATVLADVQQQLALLRAERDVLVIADRATVLTGELLALREQLQEAGARPLTFALVDMSGDAPDEDAPYGPLETLWRFDTDLLARRIFPAVDPVGSTSTLLEGAQLEATHLTVQQRARKLLRRYRELRSLVTVLGPERLSPADVTAYHRGERLEAFLTQPLFVAEPFTKLSGEWVSVPDVIEGVRRILDGAADELEVKDLMNVGRFPVETTPGVR